MKKMYIIIFLTQFFDNFWADINHLTKEEYGEVEQMILFYNRMIEKEELSLKQLIDVNSVDRKAESIKRLESFKKKRII